MNVRTGPTLTGISGGESKLLKADETGRRVAYHRDDIKRTNAAVMIRCRGSHCDRGIEEDRASRAGQHQGMERPVCVIMVARSGP